MGVGRNTDLESLEPLVEPAYCAVSVKPSITTLTSIEVSDPDEKSVWTNQTMPMSSISWMDKDACRLMALQKSTYVLPERVWLQDLQGMAISSLQWCHTCRILWDGLVHLRIPSWSQGPTCLLQSSVLLVKLYSPQNKVRTRDDVHPFWTKRTAPLCLFVQLASNIACSIWFSVNPGWAGKNADV